MSTKSKLSQEFIQRIAIELDGYVRYSSNTFAKNFSDDLSGIVRFEFIGSGIFECVCYYGSRIASIENKLKNMSFFRTKKSSTSVRQTVFQRIDKINQLLFRKNIVSSFRIDPYERGVADFYSEFIRDVEPTFSSFPDLAKYCLIDTNLPLGHHAFRIPFLLEAAGFVDQCEEYMRQVAAGGFIPDYIDFEEEFRELFLK